MKTVCRIAFRTMLLCTCFSPILFACEDNDNNETTVQKPIPFTGRFMEKLSQPLSESLIYSKGVSLQRNAVIQSIDVDRNGQLYYVQIAGGNQHQLNVIHGAPNENNPANYMVCEYFGHGTNMAIEEATDGTYIWLGSHGNKGSDGAYGGSQTVSRVKFEPGKKVQLAGEEVFHLKGTRNIHPAINTEKDILAVQFSRKVSGVNTRAFVAYRLSEALQLKPTPVVLESLKYGGEAGAPEKTETLTIQARELSQLKPLYSFAVSDGHGGYVGELAFQGFDIDDQFVYYFEGMGYNDGKPSKAYVSVLDKNGLLAARQEVKAIGDKNKLVEAGLADRGYMEAEGIKVKDGVLYLGFASRLMVGGDDKRLVNILKYDNK